MTVLRSGAATDVGRVRSANEDRLLEGVSLFAVADGMGGHAGGEVAAGLAIEALQRWFTAEPSAQGLVDAVRRANLAVWERSHRDAEVRGMGTTLATAALVPTASGDRLVVANVGDSRVYRYAGGRLVQMTVDHSVAEELVARGELSEAEAAIHPHRHILTRALGVAPDVDVDAWELSPAQGERFLLCSDGLTNEVSEARIAAVLHDVPDPRQAAQTLVGLANEHGGNDNVTVVVLDVVVADTDPAAARSGSSTADVRVGGPAVAPGAAPPVAVGPAGGPPLVAPGPGTNGVHQGSGPAGRLATTTLRPVGVPSGRLAPSPGGRTTGSDPSATPDMLARHVTTALSEVMGRGPRRHEGVLRPVSGVVRHRRRRLTVRVVLFVLLVAGVGAGAGAVVHYYAEDAYFVGLDGGQVAIYQGRPGGFLGFRPHVVRVTGLSAADVASYRVPELRDDVSEPSLAAADHFVTNLHLEFCTLQPASAACQPTSSGQGGPG